MTEVKLVVVGDKESQKAEMLITYVKGEYPTGYIPTVFESHTTEVTINKKVVHLTLWDTSNQEDFDRLRLLSYPGADVFLICFSIASQKSFENVKNRWISEIRENCPITPIILVGTHLEKRGDPKTINELKEKGLSPITYQQGVELAKEINAVNYMECSARNQVNINEVFEDAMITVIYLQKPRKEIKKLNNEEQEFNKKDENLRKKEEELKRKKEEINPNEFNQKIIELNKQEQALKKEKAFQESKRKEFGERKMKEFEKMKKLATMSKKELNKFKKLELKKKKEELKRKKEEEKLKKKNLDKSIPKVENPKNQEKEKEIIKTEKEKEKEKEKEIIKTKCVVFGDENSKKNELIFELIGKEISKGNEIIKPFGTYQKQYIFEGKEIEIIFQDTPDKIDYDGIKHTHYSEANFFLICFSIISLSSFENVKSKFIPEIKQNFPNIPIILIGNELEKRNNSIIIEELKQNNLKPITYEKGIRTAKKSKMLKYVECSFETKKNLTTILETVSRLSLKSNNQTEKSNN